MSRVLDTARPSWFTGAMEATTHSKIVEYACSGRSAKNRAAVLNMGVKVEGLSYTHGLDHVGQHVVIRQIEVGR